MPKTGTKNNVIKFVSKEGRCQVPSVKEIATMSGQLSFLAVSAYNFGMKQVAVGCEFANEELGRWWEKNGRNLDVAENDEELKPVSKR